MGNFVQPPPTFRNRCPKCGHVEGGLLKIAKTLERLLRGKVKEALLGPPCPECGEEMVVEQEPPNPFILY